MARHGMALLWALFVLCYCLVGTTTVLPSTTAGRRECGTNPLHELMVLSHKSGQHRASIVYLMYELKRDYVYYVLEIM